MSLFVKVETRALSDGKLLAAGPEALGVWLRGLLYAKEHLTDGFIPDGAMSLVTLGVTDRNAVVEKLLAEDLWERCDGGYTVGGDRWARHQTTAEEVQIKRDQGKERQRRHREKQQSAKRSVGDAGLAETVGVSSSETAADRKGVTQVTQVSRVTPEAEPEYRAQSTEPEEESYSARDVGDVLPFPSPGSLDGVAREIICAHPKAVARHFGAADVNRRMMGAVLNAIASESMAAGSSRESAAQFLLVATRTYAEAVMRWPPGEQRFASGIENFFNERTYRQDPEEWTHAAGNTKRNRSQERTDGNLDAFRRASGL